MNSQPAFGCDEMLTCIITDMANAVSERNGETTQRQLTRAQAAVAMILSFRPRDAIEAMLAGHCVMFHEVIVDSVRDTLRGEMDTMRRATRSGIVAMNKSFAGNLGLLERYQTRPSMGCQEEVAAEAGATLPAVGAARRPAVVAVPVIQASAPGAAVRPASNSTGGEVRTSGVAASVTVVRPESARSNSVAVGAPTSGVSGSVTVARASGAPGSVTAAPASVQSSSADRASAPVVPASAGARVPTRDGGVAVRPIESRPVAPGTPFAATADLPRMANPIPGRAAVSGGPSATALAAFHANPEAAAALEAGDAAAFARAMGIEPSAEFLAAAAAPGSPFDRRASGPWVIEPATERKG